MPDETFDRLKRGNFFAIHEGECVADLLRASGSPDAVDVIFGMLRHVVIDDVTDAGDVEPARGDVGCDHDFVLARLESFERFDSFALGAIGMKHRNGMLRVLQEMGDAVGALFGAAENKDAIVIRALEKRDEQVELLLGCDGINRVRDCFGRRTPDRRSQLFRDRAKPTW